MYNIDGNPITITVKQSIRAKKTVSVEIKSENEITVLLPQNIEVDVERFLEKSRGLIEKKYRDFLSSERILDENRILIRGLPHEILVKKVKEPVKNKIELTYEKIIITVTEFERPYRILKTWISNKTSELVNELIEQYSPILGEPLRVSVVDTARWGYCRKNRVLIFNWQIYALPSELAKYIVVHELIHLTHHNHQKGYHNKIIQSIPDYEEREKKLRKYLAIKRDYEFI